jgi:hypothetical protein
MLRPLVRQSTGYGSTSKPTFRKIPIDLGM